MDDLFRFLLLRPAVPAAKDGVKTLQASFARPGAARAEVVQAARKHVQANAYANYADALQFAAPARAAVDTLRRGPKSNAAVAAAVAASGLTVAQIVADPRFPTEEARLADALVAMKLLSDSSGADAPSLAELAQGYDAIRLAASGKDPVSLRVLSVADLATNGAAPPANTPATHVEPPKQVPVEHVDDHTDVIDRLKGAIATLGTMPASGFRVAEKATWAESPRATVRLDTRLAAFEAGSHHPMTLAETDPAEVTTVTTVAPPPAAIAPRSQVAQPWLLSDEAIGALPSAVRETIANVGLDLRTQPLTVVLEALHAETTKVMTIAQDTNGVGDTAVTRIGKSYAAVAANDYVGPALAPMPKGHGTIKPIGVGDLLLVKEHVLKYEGGDLAHVENVLKSEHLARETRRLERTETTVFQETETTKEETRDTQTTDRFSLKRETSDTIKTDASLKAGLAVSAKYGPMVEVKANADFATSVSAESSTKMATEFSKDVVARSASKLVERVLERRSTTTISEFEEKYSHGFDNTNGAGHISGYYQWIDKVMQAQVYNYGKRLLFDVTVPEPATNFVLTQTKVTDQGQSLSLPQPFTLSADQLNEGNYRYYGQKYQVVGLEPPPAPVKTVSKGYDAMLSQGHEATKSETLTIDDGYRAKYALFSSDWTGWNHRSWRFLVGSVWIDALGSTGYRNMSGEVGSIAIAYDAYDMETIAATVEIFCERTERAYAAWQLKVHAAITQGYQAQKQAYDQALAQAKAAAGTVIAGRNPGFNAHLVATELRKQCLTLLTAQQFDGFGALELSFQGYAQPNLVATAAQMPYVRFFEQAFEWEHITYFFYPFFWGWKPAWKNRMLLDDVDPQFGEFLRAGAARVVFPVRPGFEAAVVHYLETGEIWNGGPPPDIAGSLYVPIIKEIQEATGAPGSEVAVGDPWAVHLPTTLVRIRPNNDLPAWQKVAEEWQPTN